MDIGVADEAPQTEIADRGEDDARGGRRTGQLTASALILEGRAVQQLVSHHLQPHIEDGLSGDQHIVGCGGGGERSGSPLVLVSAHNTNRDTNWRAVTSLDGAGEYTVYDDPKI